MLVELFILLQVITLGFMFLAFKERSPMLWVFGIILAGALVVGSYGVDQHKMVVSNSTSALQADNSTLMTYNYEYVSESVSQPMMSGVNMGLFALGVLMFFFDVFSNVSDEAGDNRKRW